MVHDWCDFAQALVACGVIAPAEGAATAMAATDELQFLGYHSLFWRQQGGLEESILHVAKLYMQEDHQEGRAVNWDCTRFMNVFFVQPGGEKGDGRICRFAGDIVAWSQGRRRQGW